MCMKAGKEDRRCFHPMEYHARHASLHSFTLNPHARATQGPAGARLMMHRSDTRRSHAPRAPRHGGTASPAAVRSHSPRPRAPSLTRHGHFATLPLCHFATSPIQYVLCHPVTFCHVSQPLCGTSPSTLCYAAIQVQPITHSPRTLCATSPSHCVPRRLPLTSCHLVITGALCATSASSTATSAAVIGARRASGLVGGQPRERIVAVELRVDELQRESAAVGFLGPPALVVVLHLCGSRFRGRDSGI